MRQAKVVAHVPTKSRLRGVDWVRGIAVFAVVILHTDEGLSQVPPLWQALTILARFAVPFFLAASFYFSASTLYCIPDQFPWQRRLARLLVPYFVWSTFYLAYRTFKYGLTRQPERIWASLRDPLSLIFLGGSTLHLYFLPLLLVGTCLMGTVGLFVIRQHLPQRYLLGLTILGSLAYEGLLRSGNGFEPVSGTAFRSLSSLLPVVDTPAARLGFVAFVWGIQCLPYLLLAVSLARIPMQTWWHSNIRRPVVIVGSLTLLFGWLLPPSLYELLSGYSAMLMALTLSPVISPNRTVERLGDCAFGIYLIHLLFVETFQTIVKRMYPAFNEMASTQALLLAATAIFLLSWMAVVLLHRTPLKTLKVL